MKVIEVCDVTKEADDGPRRGQAPAPTPTSSRSSQPVPAFKFPVRRQEEAQGSRAGDEELSRDPGTRLYDNMVDGTDTYKVVLVQKQAQAEA
jgi:hypothetical protein